MRNEAAKKTLIFLILVFFGLPLGAGTLVIVSSEGSEIVRVSDEIPSNAVLHRYFKLSEDEKEILFKEVLVSGPNGNLKTVTSYPDGSKATHSHKTTVIQWSGIRCSQFGSRIMQRNEDGSVYDAWSEGGEIIGSVDNKGSIPFEKVIHHDPEIWTIKLKA